MWMVLSTTPRTATALRSAFGSPSSAGVVKATKALRGFDTTPSTSTRPSLPTSSARCSSRECQRPPQHSHTHSVTCLYIQYKQNTSTSIHTSSSGWPLTLTLTHFVLSFLDNVSFSLFYSFKSKTLSPPFSFHSSWGGNFNLFIFLFLKEDSLNPCVIPYLHEEDLIQPFYQNTTFWIACFNSVICFCFFLSFPLLICILRVLYFCTFAASFYFFSAYYFLMLGAYCKRLTVCLERRESWLDNQPHAEQK